MIKSLDEYKTGDWFADASELCRRALETDRNEVSSRPACSVGADGCQELTIVIVDNTNQSRNRLEGGYHERAQLFIILSIMRAVI